MTHPALNEPVRGRLNLEEDTRRLLDVLANGGIALVPANLGYGLVASTAEATRRLIEVKRRESYKRLGVVLDAIAEREIHVLDQRKRDIIDCITVDYNLPLGVVAKYREDHPLIQKLDPSLRKISTARGAIGTPVNDGGHLHEAMGRYSREHCVPIFGSSANLTGAGAKHRVEDIEPEIIAAADLVIDHGLCRYYSYRNTSTQINFDTMEVLRIGAAYDLISDILRRRFNWELPPDPGRDAAPHGLLHEFALVGVED